MLGARAKTIIRAVSALVFTALTMPILAHANTTTNDQNGSWGDYKFVCPADSATLTPITVLAATGEHSTFLSLFEEYDPEGFAILSDPGLADKTVWAPVDSAFEKSSDLINQLDSAEIKEILGYHISPPRSNPSGKYPIVTPRYIADQEDIKNRTRTGVLTGSDQRTVTRKTENRLYIEEIQILPTSWCTAAGSIFSIDGVILDVVPPNFVEKTYNKLIRLLFYPPSSVFIYSLFGSTVLSSTIYWTYRKFKRRKRIKE
jgi:uncharacterized surface protein with fasciclin (FAS1) repeats